MLIRQKRGYGGRDGRLLEIQKIVLDRRCKSFGSGDPDAPPPRKPRSSGKPPDLVTYCPVTRC